MSPDPMHVLQLTLGLVFLLSAGGKAAHPREFVEGLREYELIPRPLLTAAAAVLVVVEALIATAHLTGVLLAPMLAVEVTLLVAFLVVTAFALKRSRSARCLCFGRPGEAVSPRSVARLALMIAGAGVLSAHAASGQWQPLVFRWEVREAMNAILAAPLALIATSWLLSGHDVFQLATKCKRCAAEAQRG